MSVIYVAKTENYYGGDIRLFTNNVDAEAYVDRFVAETEGKTDIIIVRYELVDGQYKAVPN